MANEIQKIDNKSEVVPGFFSVEGFALLQRMARMFSSSSLVPKDFQGEDNLGNCAIALNMAQRLQADPLMVMQNLYVVYGTPSWSAKFMIAMFNQCGRYESIHYRETGKKETDTQGIVAYAVEKSSGEVIEGPEVTIKIAKDEGWYNKNGSKWKTMPDQMLRYRAAAWFIRTTAPELSMGLQTREEVIDTIDVEAVEKPTDEIRAHANTVELAPPSPTEAAREVKMDAPIEKVKAGEKTESRAAVGAQEALAGTGEQTGFEGPGF